MYQLYAKHSASLLQRVLPALQDMLAVQWSPHSAAQLAFEQVLTSAPVALLLEHGSELSSLFHAILQPELPSQDPTTDIPRKISSPMNAKAAEQNAMNSRRARAERFERVLKGLVGRVHVEIETQTNTPVGATYVERWEGLLSACKAAAA